MSVSSIKKEIHMLYVIASVDDIKLQKLLIRNASSEVLKALASLYLNVLRGLVPIHLHNLNLLRSNRKLVYEIVTASDDKQRCAVLMRPKVLDLVHATLPDILKVFESIVADDTPHWAESSGTQDVQAPSEPPPNAPGYSRHSAGPTGVKAPKIGPGGRYILLEVPMYA